MDDLKEKVALSLKTYGQPSNNAGMTTKDISDYYQKSALGYRLVHSSIGAMHMKINKSLDFQANYISQYINKEDSVLELGSGNGANINFLLNKVKADYFGVDLVEKQIARAKQKTTNKATFIIADFNKLPFPNETFTIVFAVEALCHSVDKEQTLREISRALKPGGQLLIFDGWRSRDLSSIELEAANIVEKSMAVGLGDTQISWIKAAEKESFLLKERVDFSKEIIENTEKFNSQAGFFLNKKRRFLLRLFPKKLILNGNAALLMNDLLKRGAYQYGFLSFSKNTPEIS
jgi:SAM-dependent methyltransferase